MKTTNGKAFEILTCLANTVETGRLGYALAKQRRYIETELTEFINVRNNAIMKNMVDGVLSDVGAAQANKEIEEYVNMPCEFPVYEIDVDTMVSGGLRANEMFILDFMVKEDNVA